MENLNTLTYPVNEEMEAFTLSASDLDLLLELVEKELNSYPSTPNDSPAEERFDPQQPPPGGGMPHEAAPVGPQQPPPGGDMPHGAAPFGLFAPGLQAAPTDLLLLPYYAPAEEGFGPQQPPPGGDMPHGAAPVGPQQPPTGGDMFYGAAPYGLFAPGPAPPVYQPPAALPPGFMPLAAPRRRRQVRTSLVTDRFITTVSILM